MEIVGFALAHLWMALKFIAPFILVLGAVVFVHEFGHFLVGRRCGAKVEAFSIGMGPELVGFTDRLGTRWRLSLLPLGGYVRFAGDRNAASAPDFDAIARGEAQRNGSLAGRPLAARAAIVAAGPAANLLMAVVVFSGLAYVYGETIVPARVDEVAAASPAERAGFQKGDVVKSIDGRSIETFPDMVNYIGIRPNETMTFVIARGGREMTLVATPTLTVAATPFGPQRLGRVGISSSKDPKDFRTIPLGPLGALRSGVAQCGTVMRMTGEYLSRLVVGRASPEQLSGPVRIAELTHVAASLGLSALVYIAGVLSLSLGLTNLLPVPMLDGGHLLFYAIEAVRGRALSRRAQEWGLRIGLAFVLALTLFVTANDLWRLFAA